jgi:ADP-ribose pyrophosphatase
MAELSSKTVYQAKYFRIVQKQIERKGKTITKDFIERNATVSILPISETGEIYLEKQFRDAFGKDVLEIVAGNMENGDNPLESAKRELQEETGLQAAHWQQIANWELSVNMNSTQFVFVATGLTEGQPDTDDDEEITVIKMPLAEAVEKAASGEFIASSHVAALLLYDKLKKEGKL